MFKHYGITNNEQSGNTEIIENLFSTIDFEKDDLLNLIRMASEKLPSPETQSFKINKKTNGRTYDLDNMPYDKSMIGKIYSIMQDGIPRTTQSYFGLASALQTEIFERFNNRVSERSLLARFSDIRNKTLQRPSILYAVEEVTGDSGVVVGRRRYYWMVLDSCGDKRNGLNEVPSSYCERWEERRA